MSIFQTDPSCLPELRRRGRLPGGRERQRRPRPAPAAGDRRRDLPARGLRRLRHDLSPRRRASRLIDHGRDLDRGAARDRARRLAGARGGGGRELRARLRRAHRQHPQDRQHDPAPCDLRLGGIREKLVAQDLGLDDVTLELTKMALLGSVASAPIGRDTELRFQGDGGGKLLSVDRRRGRGAARMAHRRARRV